MSGEYPQVEFGQLVRMLAESIAGAQRELDRSSAGMLEELAETEVSVVPEVREVVEPDGHVRYERARSRRVSLLDLGVTPTFYQFSESTVEVSLDITVVEETHAQGERRLGLRANTAAVQQERKLNRNLQAHSKLRATLVPVPMPAQLEPSRTSVVEETR
jgi:hypothetical protein